MQCVLLVVDIWKLSPVTGPLEASVSFIVFVLLAKPSRLCPALHRAN